MSKHYNGVTRERVKKEVIALQKTIATQKETIKSKENVIKVLKENEEVLNREVMAKDQVIEDQILNIVGLNTEVSRITRDLVAERDQNRKDKGYKFGFYAMAIINAVIIIGVNL